MERAMLRVSPSYVKKYLAVIRRRTRVTDIAQRVAVKLEWARQTARRTAGCWGSKGGNPAPVSAALVDLQSGGQTTSNE
ncbi:jg15325 [Pararge aegeria aegeria]|uniref:Jg15325 protein n=1 Tax=Pararge aegeria aegeria TaxID=348720 RepID=A0A8S4R6U7_9NEOP|nr:jg15325 [Pararge aegeria aegeria]